MNLAKVNIRKNDLVKVIAGKDKGKKGKVLLIFPKDNRVIVEKLNMIKKHTKPNEQKRQGGGIIEKEGKMHLSNVMTLCDKCGDAVRIAVKKLEDGKRVRSCRKCGEVLGIE